MAPSFGLFVLFFSLFILFLTWALVPEVRRGELVEPDNYMRLVHVRHMVESGDWFDNSIPRSNAPFGEELHWTRPLDILLIGTVLLARPFVSFDEALFLSGVILPPLLLLMICLVVAWAVTPLTGGRVQVPAALAVLFQVGIVMYALPGRPDHHPLLFLSYALTVGFSVRMWTGPFRRPTVLGAGAAGALGLWIGPEFLAALGVVMGSGVLFWLLDGKDASRVNLWFFLAFLAALVVALVAERPMSEWLAEEYDRLSSPHILLGLLGLVFWGLVGLGPNRWDWCSTPGRRLVSATTLGGGALLAMYLLYPDFFGGPTVHVDPALWESWRQYVGEDQGLVRPVTKAGIGYFLIFLGPSLLCIPFLLRLLRRERHAHEWKGWAFLALSLAVFLGLALFRVRFVAYSQVLIVVVASALFARLLSRNRGVSGRVSIAAVNVGLWVAMMIGPLFVGTGIVWAASEGFRDPGGSGGRRAAPCSVREMAPFLNDPTGLGDRPRTIVADLQFGPELLYRSAHRVLATPYHRNAEGILDARAILSAADFESSRRTASERGVGLLLLCPGTPSVFLAEPAGQVAGRSLGSTLMEGQTPDWLVRLPVPEGRAGGFLLFSVEEQQGRP